MSNNYLFMNKDKFVGWLKDRLLFEFGSNDRKGLYAATQKIMAYNSNRIEGSTLTSEQTASLFDTGTIISNGIEVYKAKDIEEMNGHFKMFNEMLKTIEQPISQEQIKSFHYQLKSGVFEDLANGYPIGEYKNRANIVSDINTVKPIEVADKMDLLIKEYENSQQQLHDIAVFHAKYEKIHPFQDGNGRTGRIILFKQCINSNIVPVVIRDDNKLIYYRALHKAQVDEQYEELVSFFTECQNEYLERISNFVDDFINAESPRHNEVILSENDQRIYDLLTSDIDDEMILQNLFEDEDIFQFQVRCHEASDIEEFTISFAEAESINDSLCIQVNYKDNTIECELCKGDLAYDVPVPEFSDELQKALCGKARELAASSQTIVITNNEIIK